MDTRKRIMMRSTFNQPVIRRLCSENDGVALICRDEVSNGIIIPKKDIFEYDPELYGVMLKYDRSLDSHPKELEELWLKAKPFFSKSD